MGAVASQPGRRIAVARRWAIGSAALAFVVLSGTGCATKGDVEELRREIADVKALAEKSQREAASASLAARNASDKANQAAQTAEGAANEARAAAAQAQEASAKAEKVFAKSLRK